jgi:hypothetical protein
MWRLEVEVLEDRAVPTAVAPPSGLVSWWTGDNTAADLTGLNHATLLNGTTYAAGKVGQAFSYDGVNDRALLTDSNSLKLTPSLSIEGWIRLNAFTTTTNFNAILFRGDSRGGLDPYDLHVNPNGTLQFGISSLTNGASVVTSTPIPLGQFIHVAGTLNDATGAMKLYINGAVVAQTVTTVRPFRDLDPTQNPAVGIGSANSTYNVPFNGLIDELSVYNRALTDAEVQGIHAAGADGKIRMFVAKTNPEQGSVVTTPPTTFAVDFAYPYNVATLQASQFQVNSTAATAFALTDADTITFTFAASPVTSDGLQTMHLNSGAVTRASDSLAAAEYAATFRYDSVPLQVTATDPVVGGNLTVQSLTTATRAVASMAGMDGGDGGWPVLYGTGAVGPNGLQLAIDEDQLFDSERGHTTEQLAFLALDGTPSGNAAPYLRSGIVSGVNNAGWTTVTLDRTYASMVVVATPNYANTSPPLVARVRNAAGNSFQVKVDRVDGQSGTVAGVPVHYTVVEEGIYTAAANGVQMEAVKLVSSLTDNSGSWVGESRAYSNSYVSPVVLGQVMTANDTGFSVFWARGTGATEPPSATALYVGKHVAQDPDTTRTPETIGYIVIEGGRGTIGATAYLAGVGADTVSGMDNGPAFAYDLTTSSVKVYFNEPIDPASLSTADLAVSQGAVIGVVALDSTTAEFRLSGVVPDVEVSMAAGAVTDQYGNPMLGFSAAYYTGTSKFLVLNDGPDRTQRYGAGSAGSPLGSWILNTANTAPRGVASNAAGTTVWVVDTNRNVYVYDSAGSLLGSWLAVATTGGTTVVYEGIATNGTDVWLLDNTQDTVFRFSGGASLRSGVYTTNSHFRLGKGSTDINAKGIVTDGTSLWVVEDGASVDKVYKYNLAGKLLGSWTIDPANSHPTGITIDPNNVSDIWIVDSGTDMVYQYTAAASRTSGSQIAAAAFSFPLAGNNTNPQDIADPPPAGAMIPLASTQDNPAPTQPARAENRTAFSTRGQLDDAFLRAWLRSAATDSNSEFLLFDNGGKWNHADLRETLEREQGLVEHIYSGLAKALGGIRRIPSSRSVAIDGAVLEQIFTDAADRALE